MDVCILLLKCYKFNHIVNNIVHKEYYVFRFMVKKLLIIYLFLANIFSVGISHATDIENTSIDRIEVVGSVIPDVVKGMLSIQAKVEKPQPCTNYLIFDPCITIRYKNALFRYQNKVAIQLKAIIHNINTRSMFILSPRYYVMGHTQQSEDPHLIS